MEAEKKKCAGWGVGLDRLHPHTAHNLLFFTPSYLACFYPPHHPTTAPFPRLLYFNSAPWQHTAHKVLIFAFLFLLSLLSSHISLFHLQLLPSLPFSPDFLRSLPPSLSRAPPTRRLEPLRVSVTSLTRSFPIDIPTFPCTFPPHARGVYPPHHPPKPLFSFHTRLTSRAA